MVFGWLRKKKKKPKRQLGIVMSDEQVAELVRLDEFSLEEKIEERVEERLKQQKILAQKMSQIKPAYQKLLLAVTPEDGAIILGYPESYTIMYDEYWIYYQERPPSWLDSLWWSLARFLGKQPPHKVIKAHKKIVQWNTETITILAKSIVEYRGTGVQEAIPMTIHPAIPRGWEAYEAVKAERDKYRDKYFRLLHEAQKEVELALNINPRVKVYWKEKEQQGKKSEERFGGTEMIFEDNPIKRELKNILEG